MEVKWIKLAVDMFNNRKIKQIENLPNGDSIIVIWVKLLLLAGTVNDGGAIYFTEELPYTEEMLATEFGKDISLVRMALNIFRSFGMIDIVDDVIMLSGWSKYQSVDKLDKIREQTRQRVANYRSRQKQLECNVTSSVTVTQCNETDIDIEKDKEIDNIINDVISFLNARIGSNYKTSTTKTRSCIKARVKEGFALDDFKDVIDKKACEWLGTDYEKYLRPETLFGTKFEGYLNQNTKSNNLDGFYDMARGWADE